MERVILTLEGMWVVAKTMAPYLLFGFFAAGLLSVWLPPRIVEKYLSGFGIGPVLRAALIGVPMPLCSCSVIPVATSLKHHGASKGATAAFLLSTPQTGVDSILVTYGLLGPVFAIFRPVAAFLTGLVGGLIVGWNDRDDRGTTSQPEVCRKDCCADQGGSRWIRALRYGFIALPSEIGADLLVGIAIAGIITAWVPEDFFATIAEPGLKQMLLMILLGIPIYVCATASVPIAAALMSKGISPGAAFVFLVAGPATNAATVVTLWRLLGWRNGVVYMATLAVSGLLGGFILDTLFQFEIAEIPAICHMPTAEAGSVWAVLLLGCVIANGLWGRKIFATLFKNRKKQATP